MTFDAEGNLTEKTKGASAETWTYGYDHRNQMTWVEKRATDGGTQQLRTDCEYMFPFSDALDALSVAITSNRVNWIVDADIVHPYPDQRIRARTNRRRGSPVPSPHIQFTDVYPHCS